MNTLKKGSLLILMMMLLVTSATGQRGDDSRRSSGDISFLKRLVVGGNIGLGYANGWNINLSPTLGYKITNSFIAGVGVTYIYSDFTNPFYGFRSTQNVLGGRAYAQHLLFRGIYAHAEYEYLDFTTTLRDDADNIIDELDLAAPGLLLGGGYSSSFGYGFGFGLEVLYNVIYKASASPYPSPLIIRGGITYGF